MGDGYFSEGHTILCTDNFTKEEILILIDVLSSNFDINATPLFFLLILIQNQ